MDVKERLDRVRKLKGSSETPVAICMMRHADFSDHADSPSYPFDKWGDFSDKS